MESLGYWARELFAWLPMAFLATGQASFDNPRDEGGPGGWPLNIRVRSNLLDHAPGVGSGMCRAEAIIPIAVTASNVKL
jgi:hypothetical protein